MEIIVTERLVNVTDGSILGFLVSAGGQYKVAVTQAFGKENGVEDMDIAEFLDVPTIEAVPAGPKQYAVVERNIGFMEDLQDTPSEIMGAMRVFWGYVFKDQHIVPLDSKVAFDRMIAEAKGLVVE